MTPYKLVIFDWDGTLMDSAGKIVSCMQHAAQATAMFVPTADAVRHIIGISLKPAIAQLFNLKLGNPVEEKQVDRIVEAYKTAYLEVDQTPCPLFDGTMGMLTALQACDTKMAVATGKARRGLKRAWDSTNTSHFFVDSRCADEAESKPSPDMLEQLLKANGLKASDAVMIGDTSYDMQMAEQLGMDRIAVSYGVHDVTALRKHSPVFVADSVSSLQGFLLRPF
ncbi:HAD family hydrolase [Alteromonas sediminis]|uniref:HAD family hydrolase n=1 Tax=Alteromonas sediminis TaxID=2259342 RepID=A0A3N5Y3D3_9ALTE|nr:HAD-IA family hydrolase [Alteromonas sediminis]RPJ67296.1 HAD family hydrolase [Alteromonas sediminis]